MRRKMKSTGIQKYQTYSIDLFLGYRICVDKLNIARFRGIFSFKFFSYISSISHQRAYFAVLIDHNTNWTDADRESKEKFWMHRQKSIRPAGINELNDHQNKCAVIFMYPALAAISFYNILCEFQNHFMYDLPMIFFNQHVLVINLDINYTQNSFAYHTNSLQFWYFFNFGSSFHFTKCSLLVFIRFMKISAVVIIFIYILVLSQFICGLLSFYLRPDEGTGRPEI